MNWKIATGITLVVAGVLLWGTMTLLKKRAQPPVTVTLRITVTPAEQVAYVTGRANSAQFKYLMGKQSGVKPVLAQKLALKPVPQSALVEAQLSVLTKEEGRRYTEVFLPTLQDLCGRQVKLTLLEQSVR